MSSRYIRQIRDELIEYTDGEYDLTTRELAEVFGVSKTTIVRVLNDE